MDDNGNANDPDYVLDNDDLEVEDPVSTGPGPSKPSKVRLPAGAGTVFKEFDDEEGPPDAVTGKPKAASRCKHCSKLFFTRQKGNLETHLSSRHPQVAAKVQGES